MITNINYLVPFLGLMICLFVIFTRSIDTKCPIRATKIVLWIIIWTIIIYYDYPWEIDKLLSITIVRCLMLTVSILYIVEAAIYAPRRQRKKMNELNKSAP